MKRVVVSILLLCATQISVGKTIYVPMDSATIQAAVDGAESGDTIMIAPGTYTGDGNRDVEIFNKSLVIKSELGPDSTIIDCEASSDDSHRGFSVSGSYDEYVELCGLAIRNGFAPGDSWDGGAIDCDNIDLTIAFCNFDDCAAWGSGGVLRLDNGRLSLLASSLRGNFGWYGGALSLIGCPSVMISGCDFDTCVSATSGGAIQAVGCTLSVGNCFFIDQFVANGFPMEEYGAAVYLNDCQALFDSCAFYDNIIGERGGGLAALSSEVELTYCTFFGNVAGDDWGETQGGAALYLSGGVSQISNCSFSHNRTFLTKGTITIANGNSATIENSIIAFSTQARAIDGSATLTCCDVYGNDGGDWVDEIASQLGVDGNFSLDPEFCDTATGDLRLNRYSPCTPEGNDCGVLIGGRAVGCEINCGDANGDEIVNITDAVFLVGFIFGGGGPTPYDSADADCNGIINISDSVYLIAYIFAGGPEPCANCP